MMQKSRFGSTAFSATPTCRFRLAVSAIPVKMDKCKKAAGPNGIILKDQLLGHWHTFQIEPEVGHGTTAMENNVCGTCGKEPTSKRLNSFRLVVLKSYLMKTLD